MIYLITSEKSLQIEARWLYSYEGVLQLVQAIFGTPNKKINISNDCQTVWYEFATSLPWLHSRLLTTICRRHLSHWLTPLCLSLLQVKRCCSCPTLQVVTGRYFYWARSSLNIQNQINFYGLDLWRSDISALTNHFYSCDKKTESVQTFGLNEFDRTVRRSWMRTSVDMVFQRYLLKNRCYSRDSEIPEKPLINLINAMG